jgi:hypothetical protein
VRRYSYVCNVTTPCGAIVTHLVGGSSALAALHNIRRSLKGAWLRIEVGTGMGTEFRVLQEVSR